LKDGTSWTTFPDGTSAATTATVTGLSNGTLYYFRVAAVNDAATGEFSDAVTATPIAAFSPLDLSPVLWLDASDTSTITEVGGAVSQWDDKSGNGYDVAQGTAAAQPTSGTRTINSLNVLDFDGSSDYLQIVNFSAAISQPNTVFVVASQDAGGSDVLIDSGTASPRTFFRTFLNQYQLSAGTGLSGGVPNTNPHIHMFVANSTSSVIEIDGSNVASGNAGTNGMDGATIGGAYSVGSYWDGAIAEVIIVDGTLTAEQIADTEQYLANKWGITL